MPRVAGLVLTALLLVVPSLSLAQIGGGGSIQGTVLDTSGAPVPGATVTATNPATGIQTVRQTTEAGVFALTPLQPGEYRVSSWRPRCARETCEYGKRNYVTGRGRHRAERSITPDKKKSCTPDSFLPASGTCMQWKSSGQKH